MMDPLTSFAAAGNVLQFIEFGTSLVGKAIEYSRPGGSKECNNPTSRGKGSESVTVTSRAASLLCIIRQTI